MSQLPEGFLSQIARYPQLEGLKASLLTEPDISVRINPAKVDDGYTTDLQRVPWCKDGYYLPRREQFTFDPKFHQGLYYVQDASSMAITEVIRHLSDGSAVRYLDACAAPGGKTTAALSVLPEGSVVVANEYDYKRAEILAENLSKWGNPNVIVSRGNTSRLAKLTGYFDIVAVDAPCSGEGMMRKEPQAVAQWSPSLIEQCAETQREILTNVWRALRPGGYLIYSTCTFNTAENEQNLSWIVDSLGGEPVSIPVLDESEAIVKGLDTTYPCYRFIPGRVKGEGLFISVVRKPGNTPPPQFKAKPQKPATAPPRQWFTSEMCYLNADNEIYAIPAANYPFMSHVASKLDVILVGVHAATVKGRDLIPTHELVLSQAFMPSAFAQCDLDYRNAIKYLQRDNVTLQSDAPKGYVVLTYGAQPLGIVKNLGNRSNTLMPKPWRILSQTIPEQAPTVI